ncbi:putative Ig domain-containing protein [Geobacter sp. DSM 9736]|uniref:putative Ig domain-containing protein n=1 Tax=Geobacter sp. DSM 9736 TaxID=1277350 RepID=UPI0015611CAD|nr:putative Ig domain-containing protein [Geobacter sp. DSM 9736]
MKQDEILVKFRENVSEVTRQKVHLKHGSKKIREFLSKRLHHVKIKAGISIEDAIRHYESDPEVEYAEPDFLYSHHLVPNDSGYSQQWGLMKIDAPTAWDTATGSNATVVAVIDSGVDYTHPDLAPNMWTNSGEIAGNGLDDDGNGYVDDIYGINPFSGTSDPMDENGHGTHVAGIIGAAGNNGEGVAGVTWNTKILACKAGDAAESISTSSVIACLNYLKTMKSRGVNIVASNNSWGGWGYSKSLYEAIKAQTDILFIASAGNDTGDNDKIPVYPSGFNLPNVISVTATDGGDGKARFSNYGKKSVHIAAPGESIYSTRPGDSYGSGSGTSLAAPFVTGLAGLIKSHYPDSTGARIKNLILAGGDPVAEMTEVSITGRRINAARSLACVDRPVFSVIDYPSPPVTGVAATLSVLSINCDSPAGPVVVTTASGQSITLLDDGAAPDSAASDGIFTGTWVPQREGEYLTFTSPAGAEGVETPALTIASTYIAEGNTRTTYSFLLRAQGGMPPYRWDVLSGNLPPGLSLNSTSGEISGIPATPGTYSFNLQVTDGLNRAVSIDTLIKVVDAPVVERWANTFDNGYAETGRGVVSDGNGNVHVGVDSSSAGDLTGNYVTFKYDASGNVVWREDYSPSQYITAHGIAIDGFRNTYVTGYLFSGKCLTLKRDSLGNLLWSKTIEDMNCYGVATDQSDGIYLAGYSNGTTSDAALVKLDAAGNVIWTKKFDSGSSDQFNAVTVDREGNILATGSKGGLNTDCITNKYDGSGNLLWSTTYDSSSYNESGTGITTDADKNIIVASSTSSNNYLTIKYDADGGLLWARTYSAGASSVSTARGIVADRLGNLYVTGSSRATTSSTYDFLTLKYNPEGVVLWSKTFDMGGGENAYGIALDGAGSIYVTGNSQSGVNTDAVTVKYSEFPLIVTSSLPEAYSGVYYGRSLAVTGGKSPYTWSVASGALPEGLTLDGSSGTISGVPTAAGSYSFAVEVADSEGATASKDFSVSVHPPLAITVASMPGAKTGLPYLEGISGGGGKSPYSWSITSGSLPDGLTLDGEAGVIAGTPLLTGSFTFTVLLADSNGSTVEKPLSIVVFPYPPVVTTLSLAVATTGEHYGQTLTAAGGDAPYTWSVISGSLPSGMTLHGLGTLSGTPSATGSYTFVVMVTDAQASTSTQELTINVYEPLRILTTALSSGEVGVPYFDAVDGAGGKTRYSWSVSSGSLPDGLFLGSAMGVISGTPIAAGTFAFTIQLTDGNGFTVFKPLTVTIDSRQLTVTTSSLPGGATGAPYEQALAATGGTSPYSWSIISGSLPDGLVLNQTTGAITGIPGQEGDYSFTVRVTDAASARVDRQLALAVSCSTLPARVNGLLQSYFGTLQAAYAAAGDGNVIELRNVAFADSITFNRGIHVVIKGGYDCSYSGNEGLTAINGPLVINAGSIDVEHLVIR